jgi:hypothetical protein
MSTNKKQMLIVLPKILSNPVYVEGLDEPLQLIADILADQGEHNYARSLREAAIVCQAFSQVNLRKTHTLYKDEPNT